MSILTQASHQWAIRPDDERFTSLTDLAKVTHDRRMNSTDKTVSNRKLTCAPVEGDHKGLVVIGPNGSPVVPSHWSFGQLATRAGAPAGYMRSLPSELAADCLNHGLRTADVEEVKVMLTRGEPGQPANLAAVTGPNYGRIWNSEVAEALVKRFGDGITGDFRVPGEFGKAVEVTKANTTLYASDRDMFVFLADEVNRVEFPNRRNGQSGSLARGFFVWNSEVGSQTLGVATFYFDYACCNRIVWGAEGFKEIRMRHTSGAPDRFIEQVKPALVKLAQGSTHNVVEAIKQAQKERIDDVNEFLAKRFTKSQVKAINLAHLVEEQRPIETIWDAATGATAFAKTIEYQDERVAIERQAGLILDLVKVPA